MNVLPSEDFYVVAREAGAQNPSLPTWANITPNPVGLSKVHGDDVRRVDIPEVPGAFQLLNVLTKDECERFIKLTEKLGYLEDAPVSLPRRVRHNDNVTWVVDNTISDLIWQRSRASLNGIESLYNAKKPVGINGRFRFYRYQKDDFFKPHTDGDWPGSSVIDKTLVHNAYPDRWSRMTFLILLSDEFSGGSTQFWVDKDNPALPARTDSQVKKVNVRTPAGAVLCFPHGQHPMHCLHSSESITQGVKYIIRTDLLFEL